MSFSLDTAALSPERSTLRLHGRLDALTFGDFDGGAAPVLEQMGQGGTVVLDLSALDYISSAGLRSIAKIRKAMRAREGHTLLVNPQPQVRKVFEIVKAVPVSDVFSSVEELDEYLDRIQKRVLGGDDDDV
ncbi:STAS domain-containing protein [Dyella sp. LX-66]|uniref:STAS domain-containing protein n=1 Tax=unclassified Dyella TaxID=2634549 RepID=UPI001BE0D73C|nr:MULTISPECIES: STAS domain-containing protein [unclassified Dyella]MBT2118029.1 STAS domain-containing protein [Dyella sp. LX-1]MBT2140936.1 STAS domain-containing protein [Dyella sp. LX-66]